MSLRYLSARVAQQIDDELMSAAGAYSLDQLMELAGQACAVALARVYDKAKYPRVLVCCGPGNQGGDGLVAARHLGFFGYKTSVFMPKPGSKEIYQRLKTQCDNMQILTTSDLDSLKTALASSDVILDAIFGFSFKPPVRAPFDEVLPLLTRSRLPIVSVDIPSGWDVEGGRPSSPLPGTDGSGGKKVDALDPDVLISLTAPKEGVREYRGRHFLGGRFVPKSFGEKFGLNLPEYPTTDLVVELLAPSENTANKL
ncbi:YjeF N-terminal domain-like protein [Thelephora ganbajun]|uniref:YjeF N-terminal domain-like protein n=1 Tax=Thelephora ganbajun TaxID=370292 RepID=A0ACB6Z287_THEGA|nr:YjeF N-terminal domain-like protein [Thelephora ganbajun]